jgi:hypothetical protein
LGVDAGVGAHQSGYAEGIRHLVGNPFDVFHIADIAAESQSWDTALFDPCCRRACSLGVQVDHGDPSRAAGRRLLGEGRSDAAGSAGDRDGASL